MTQAEQLIAQIKANYQPKSADRHDLEALRMSVARLAQILQVQTEQLPVLEVHSVDDLATLCMENKGWNTLVAECMDAVRIS
jgi:Tfp pilus assembly protein PilO